MSIFKTLNRSFSSALSLSTALRPKEVIQALDRHIIGQPEAKRAVAIALRNRWRRHQIPEELKNEVIPKNILMIGPTGCGKTEIARRIAKLTQAPFIKVEATKFTEVGFHGKDVDQIIIDLVDISINMTRKRIAEEVKHTVASNVEAKIIEGLLGKNIDERALNTHKDLLRMRLLEDVDITIDVPVENNSDFSVASFPMMPNTPQNGIDIKRIVSKIREQFRAGDATSYTSRTVPIAQARDILTEMESEKLLKDFDVVKEAISSVEQNGIVFIDEIDKICAPSGDYRRPGASDEGVQRDLLPIIEGSTVTTPHGNVNTDFILFIASGAFHSAKPSDLLAELQGRLPIRVNLKGLTEDDMYRILTEPVSNLIRQQVDMMKAEDVDLVFTDGAIREVAKIAAEVNRSVENIGARRLHTIIERVVEEISYEAPDKAGQKIEVTADYVKERVGELMKATDMRRYIL